MTSTTPVLGDLDVLAAQEPFVRALAKSLLFDDSQVDDVVQETWIEALRRGIPAGAGARSWLSRVVRSRALNALRGRRRRQHRESAAARPEALPSAADILSRNEQRQRVIAAVAALAEPYRSAILLRYFEGLEPRAIAQRLEQPIDTVNTRLRRARTLLRERLDAESGGDRRAWMLALVPIAASRGVARGAVMAKVFGFLALLSAMKPLLFLVAASLLALLLARNLSAPSDPERNQIPPVVTQSATDRVAAVPDGSAEDRSSTTTGDARIAAPAIRSRRDGGLGPDQLAGLTGILVSPEGTVLPARRCRLLSLDPLQCHPGAFEPDHQAIGAAFSALEVETDEQGRFRFESIPAGQSHALWLGHGGPHATLRPLGFALRAGELVDLGIVALAVRGAVVGRVVSEDGAPIEGALVRAVDIPGALLGLAPIDRLEAGGALLCAFPDPKEILTAPNTAAVFAERMRRFLGRDVPTADADAPLCVLPFPGWFDAALAALPIPSATTDADGRFRIEGLVDGEHALLVAADGYARHIEPRVVIQHGELRDRGPIRLASGDTFTARVIDASGEPVVGAEVRVAVRPRVGLTGILFASAPVRTEATGRAVFANLPRSDLVVAVRASVGHPWHVEAEVASDEDFDITLPNPIAAHLKLVRDSAPFVGAVEVVVRAGPPMGEVTAAGLVPTIDVRLEAVTGEPGEYHLHDLTPGVYTVDVLAEHCALAQAVLWVDPSRPSVTTTIDLGVGHALEVSVVDASGRALSGCDVWVFPSADESAAYARSILFAYGGFRAWDRLGRGGRRTDGDGRVRIEHLPAGSAAVLVRHRGLGTRSERVDVAAGELRVVLREAGSVRGIVTDSGRRPEPGRVVLTRRPIVEPTAVAFPVANASVRLDADGRFAVDGLTPGEWEFHAERAESPEHESFGRMLRGAEPIAFSFGQGSGRSIRVAVESGVVHEVAIDVDPLHAGATEAVARVFGTVTMDGAPVVGQTLRSRAALGGWRQDPPEFAVTDAAGRYQRDGVRSEVFELSWRISDRPRIEWSLDVHPPVDSEHRVDISLTTRELEIVVVGPTGLPAADAGVWFHAVLASGATIRCATHLDARGSARLRVPIASYQVGAEGSMGSVMLEGFDPTTTARLELRLAEDKLVRGIVSLPDAQKLRAVQFRESDTTNYFQLFVYDTTQFSTTGMKAGRYEVVLLTEDGEFDAEPKVVDIPTVGPTDLRLRLGARREF
ncbi:MAG: sigma-70 family RNA polymerase sigma factor [Planctomycetota bacterium]